MSQSDESPPTIKGVFSVPDPPRSSGVPASVTPARKRRKTSHWWESLWVLLIFPPVVFAAILAFLVLTKDDRPSSYKCANNLRQIGLACFMYAMAHNHRFPDTLNDVLREEDIPADVFVCPETKDTPARGRDKPDIAAHLTAGGHLSYIYAGKGLTDSAGGDAVLVYEPLSNHHGEGMEVVYADGHVEWMDAQYAARVVSEIQAGHNPPRPETQTQPATMP